MWSLLEVLNFLLQCGLHMTALNVRNRTAHDEFLLLKQQLTASGISIILQIASIFESALKPGSHTYALPRPAHAVHSGVTTDSGMHRGATGMFSGEHGSRVHALYQASAPPALPATAAHQSWFCKIFGFEETDGGHIGTFAFVRSQLHVAQTTLGAYVFTTPQGKKLWAGRFTQESLCNLHGKLQVGSTPRGQIIRPHSAARVTPIRQPPVCISPTRSFLGMCPSSTATLHSAAPCSK